MLRGLWLLVAALAAAGVAFVLFPEAPALVDVLVGAALGDGPSALAGAPYIAFSVSVGLGLFAFFLATVAAAALWEGVNLATAVRRATELLRRHRLGDVVYPHDFVAAVAIGAAQEVTEQYAQGIHKEQPVAAAADAPGRFVSEIPAASLLLTRGFIEKPLFLDMLRPLPSVFFGLGAFGLLIGLIDGLSRARAPAGESFGGESFARGFEAGLVAAMAPLLLGVLCWFVAELLVGWRSRRVQMLCRVLDSLFPPATPAFYLRQLAAQTAAGPPVGELLAGAGAELTRHFARLEMNLEAHESARNAALRDAIEDGLKAPVKVLAGAAARLADDQAGGVEKLLDQSLAAFVAELQQILRADLDAWQKQLAAAAGQLREMRAALAEAPDPSALAEMLARLAERPPAEAADPSALAEALRQAVDIAMATAHERQAEMLARLAERSPPAEPVDPSALAEAIATAVEAAMAAAHERQAEMLAELAERLAGTARRPAPLPAPKPRAPVAAGAERIVEALEELRAENEELPKL